MGWVDYTTFGPYWLPRLIGVQTQATITNVGGCPSSDDESSSGVTITIQFTDTHGTQHTLSPDTCYGSDYQVDQTLPIWYLPNDPQHFVTKDGEGGLASGAITLTIGALIGLLLLLCGLVLTVVGFFSKSIPTRRRNIS